MHAPFTTNNYKTAYRSLNKSYLSNGMIVCAISNIDPYFIGDYGCTKDSRLHLFIGHHDSGLLIMIRINCDTILDCVVKKESINCWMSQCYCAKVFTG